MVTRVRRTLRLHGVKTPEPWAVVTAHSQPHLKSNGHIPFHICDTLGSLTCLGMKVVYWWTVGDVTIVSMTWPVLILPYLKIRMQLLCAGCWVARKAIALQYNDATLRCAWRCCAGCSDLIRSTVSALQAQRVLARLCSSGSQITKIQMITGTYSDIEHPVPIRSAMEELMFVKL